MMMWLCGCPPSLSSCVTTTHGEPGATRRASWYPASVTSASCSGSLASISSFEKDWMIVSAWFLRPVPRVIASICSTASIGEAKSESSPAAREREKSAGRP